VSNARLPAYAVYPLRNGTLPAAPRPQDSGGRVRLGNVTYPSDRYERLDPSAYPVWEVAEDL